MSIDKTIDFFNGLECHTPQAKDARDVAIDTMRKYQKIRDKISTIYVGYRHGYEVMADVMEILREVEDGNDE